MNGRWRPLYEVCESDPALAGIAFDAVGTLIRSAEPIPCVYERFGRRHGSRLSATSIAERFPIAWRRAVWQPSTNAQHRLAWRAIVSEVFDDVDEPGGTLFEALWDHFGRPTSWVAYHGVQEMLSDLASRNYQLAIASNFDDRLLSICAAISDLAPCRHIMSATALGTAKPNPKFFQAVATRLRLQPRQLLMVGDDSELDIAAARAAGWSAVQLI
jgi:putative hydrolase of the HAD superfamily